MLQVEIQHPKGKLERLQVPDDCIIGKGAQNEVRLESWRIGKEHARLFKTPSGVLVEDLGAFGGVTVNGQRIEAQYGPLTSGEVIGIGPFKLSVQVLVGSERVQAAHPGSRSDTAAARNRMASEAMQASRLAAERAQREAARSDTPAPGLALVLAPEPGR